jgi:rubrerythrin
MNLDTFDLNELLLTAMKSEIDSKAFYLKLSAKMKNYLIKDKFEFLAQEEEKHRVYIEDIYKAYYPNQKIKIPKTTPVPLPKITPPDDDTPLSKILREAMQAEQAAQEFYQQLAERFIKDTQIQHMLQYFATMELQHYKILEIEKASMERFEEADVYWPMVHAGP